MSERQFSRCEQCGKRLAHLGPAQVLPCPSSVEDSFHCSEVMRSLVLSRRLRTGPNCIDEPYHPETLDLLERTGLSWDRVDARIKREDAIGEAERFLRYDTTMCHPLADWINGDWDRAAVVAKWALSQINICDGSTLGEISRMIAELGEDVGTHIDSLADDLEIADVAAAILARGKTGRGE